MTVKFKKLPLFGEGLYAGNPTVTRERRLNCYYQVRKDNDRTAVAVLGTPGMKLQMVIPSMLMSPARGILANRTQLFVVALNQFFSLQTPAVAGGTATVLASGNINSSSGSVSMAQNPTQVCLVDGANGAFVQITSAGFPNGATTVTFCNGFFICEMPGTNQFFVSNYNDGSIWNALSFAAASQYTDGIICTDQLGGLLIPFSSTHLEFWQNAGQTTEPFTYIQGTATEYGLAATFSRVHLADSLCFLTQTKEGGLQFGKISQYQVKVISTPDIDKIVQSLSVTADCVGLAYQVGEAKFAQFTFPTAGRSFLYNAANDMWSESQSGITSGYAARHIGQYAAVYNGQSLLSDYNGPNLYRADVGTFTDNGNTIVREVITRCALNNQNVFRSSQIYMDMEVGVGVSSGQGVNPVVAMSIARDSRDFGPEQIISLGATGQYSKRVVRRRNGRGRFLHMRLRMTDPVKFVISGGAVIASARGGVGQARAGKGG
jgi:hypothetical protein